MAACLTLSYLRLTTDWLIVVFVVHLDLSSIMHNVSWWHWHPFCCCCCLRALSTYTHEKTLPYQTTQHTTHMIWWCTTQYTLTNTQSDRRAEWVSEWVSGMSITHSPNYDVTPCQLALAIPSLTHIHHVSWRGLIDEGCNLIGKQQAAVNSVWVTGCLCVCLYVEYYTAPSSSSHRHRFTHYIKYINYIESMWLAIGLFQI